MPLKAHVVEKLVPDESGGWFWMRKPGKDWEPVYVCPAERGWHQHIRDTHQTSVHDVNVEWGPEIVPPNKPVMRNV